VIFLNRYYVLLWFRFGTISVVDDSINNVQNAQETTNSNFSHKKIKVRTFIIPITIILMLLVIASLLLVQSKKPTPRQNFVNKVVPTTEPEKFSYGGSFYRKDGKVIAHDNNNVSIKNIELSDADPNTFRHLQGLAGYDKGNFYYLKYDYAKRMYFPVTVPLIPEIKQLFDLVKHPGQDIIIIWRQNADTEFANVTYSALSEYGDYNAFRVEIFEILNNGKVIGYLWANGISKTNVVNNKLYLYTDTGTTGYKRAVYEVTYGNQPELILDIEPDKTTFRQGGSKIYYTKSFNTLDLYEFDIETKTDREIAVKYPYISTNSSRITLTPDEQHLLTQSTDEDDRTRTLLIDKNTGEFEVVLDKEVQRMGGEFPFTVSPKNDKVFFLTIPYEGYMFTYPTYVEKNPETGNWGKEKDLKTINMEVGGGWNIDTGQWSVSPSGRYLAVADASEDSIFFCAGFGGTPRAHNVIKILDLETLKIQILTKIDTDEDFSLNYWAVDDSGIYATKYKMLPSLDQDCSETVGEGTQEFYLR